MSNCVWATNCQEETNSSPQTGMKEHDYMGISAVSSLNQKAEKSVISQKTTPEKVNLSETDLRLGLGPPEQPNCHHELKDLLPRENTNKRIDPTPETEVANTNSSTCPENGPKCGVKRGYVEVLHSGSAPPWPARANVGVPTATKTNLEPSAAQVILTTHTDSPRQGNQSRDALPQKAQVIGWPPIGPFRKNAVPANRAGSAKGSEGNDNPSSLYVKVNMDGVPVGRKVDLKAYQSYEGLSQALKDMFHMPLPPPTTGGCSQTKGGGAEGSESLFQFLPGLKLTYEDKDGDWMLVGDVPWSMFVSAVRRLHIMKESQSVTNSAPSISEKPPACIR